VYVADSKLWPVHGMNLIDMCVLVLLADRVDKVGLMLTILVLVAVLDLAK
jgi:hypothetical protein